MIEKYCVFMRGINVGGVKIKMDDLKKAFVSMSYPDAKTILATGNVIISAGSQAPGDIKREIEKNLSDTFKYDAAVFIRTSDQIAAAVEAAGRIGTPADCHLYYLICDDNSIISALGHLFAALPHRQNETYTPHGDGAFWLVPVGETLESPFGKKVLGDKKYRNVLTSRNMNTIEKIAAAMRGEKG